MRYGPHNSECFLSIGICNTACVCQGSQRIAAFIRVSSCEKALNFRWSAAWGVIRSCCQNIQSPLVRSLPRADNSALLSISSLLANRHFCWLHHRVIWITDCVCALRALPHAPLQSISCGDVDDSSPDVLGRQAIPSCLQCLRP